jgi:hypothetical protein
MSHVYNPSAVAITNTTLPDDGDLASATSVNTPLEDALDGAKYCQDSIDGTSTGTMVPADLNVGAGLLIVDASGGGTVTAGCEFVAAAPVTCVSTTTLNGAATCNTTLQVIGTTTMAGINCTSLVRSGSFSVVGSSVTVASKLLMGGPTVLRYTAAVGDVNQSINCTNTDIFDVQAGTFTADRNGTITNGADAGQIIRLVSHETGTNLLVKNFAGTDVLGPNASALKIVANPSGTDEFSSALLMWTGSIWHFVGQ